MPDQIDRYSTTVKWAKRILPVFSVLLLISIFTLTKNDAIRNGTILLSNEVINLASGQKITNPHFSGVTDAGDAFIVAADEALPDAPQPKQIDLINPRLEVNTTDGLTLRSSSTGGSLNIKTQLAELSGDVVLQTSNGYRAQSQNIQFNLNNGSALSESNVSVEGPIGSIEAGRFEAMQPQKAGQVVLEFSKGVHLIYLPSGNKSAK